MPDLPAACAAVVCRAAAKIPADRYQSTGELIEALARAGEVEPDETRARTARTGRTMTARPSPDADEDAEPIRRARPAPTRR